MLDTIVTIASDKIEQMKMRNAESSFLLLEEGLRRKPITSRRSAAEAR